MSKPDDIPTEAWGAAVAAFKEMCREVEGSDDREIIALAIMAAEKRGEERERAACAEAVRCMIPSIGPDGPENAVHEAEYSALGFAMTAIRKRGEG